MYQVTDKVWGELTGKYEGGVTIGLNKTPGASVVIKTSDEIYLKTLNVPGLIFAFIMPAQDVEILLEAEGKPT